jgi:hypothetical protein
LTLLPSLAAHAHRTTGTLNEESQRYQQWGEAVCVLLLFFFFFFCHINIIVTN